MGSQLVPVAEPDRSSSALALGRVNGRLVALLADEDDLLLRVVSLPDGAVLTNATLSGMPGHVIVTGAGRILVSLRDANVVQSFFLSCAGALPSRCAFTASSSFSVASEPTSLAVSADQKSLFVVSTLGQAITRFALPGGEQQAVATLPRDPRAILLGARSDVAFIAHGSGSALTTAFTNANEAMPTREARLDYRDHVFDEGLAHARPVSDEPRFAGQGFALARVDERVLSPMALMYPGDPSPTPGYGPSTEGYFPQEMAMLSMGADAHLADGADDAGSTAPKLRVRATVVAADKNRVSSGRVAWPKDAPPCLLPRAAAPVPDHHSVLVACMGIDQVVEIAAAEKPLLESVLTRVAVPAGPTAIAVDAETHEAWVWSMFERKLSRLSLSGPAPVVSIAVAARTALDPGWSAGRVLFHAPIAFDGRACASCHADARADGITWTSPNGPLQTPVHAGRIVRAGSFGWLGESATLPAHLRQTLARLSATRTLDDKELLALIAYIKSARTYRAPSHRTEVEERGFAIFQSTETRCSQCHHQEGFRGDGARHDVGTGGSYDTPSLRQVGTTGPYMHDGRYATLREALLATDGKMGSTKQLSESDTTALIAYLRSL